MRKTKIVCTIGPATASRRMLDRLVAAGMDVARLNFSHGTRAEHGEGLRAIREREPEWGRPITILQDLQGPKVRLGAFVGGQAILVTGERFILTPRPVKGTASRSSISHPEFLAVLRPGDQVWMDDGMIQLVVEKVEDGEVLGDVHLSASSLEYRKSGIGAGFMVAMSTQAISTVPVTSSSSPRPGVMVCGYSPPTSAFAAGGGWR